MDQGPWEFCAPLENKLPDCHSLALTANTPYFEVPDNQPDFAISTATCFNIPANRDVYNFTSVKVAKEPMIWLAVRIWFVVEPILEGAEAVPLQFDWW